MSGCGPKEAPRSMIPRWRVGHRRLMLGILQLMWRRTSSTRIGLKSHPIVAPEAVEAGRHKWAEDEVGPPVLVAREWLHHPDLVGPEAVAEDRPEMSSTCLDLVVLPVIKAVMISATSS